MNDCRNYYLDAFNAVEVQELTDNLFKYYDENKNTVRASDADLLAEIEYEFKRAVTSIEDYSDLMNNFVDAHCDEIEYDEENEEYMYEGYSFDEDGALQNELKEHLYSYVYDYLGYDGYIGTSFNGSDVYVCIEPNQIKSIDNLYPTKSNNMYENNSVEKNIALEKVRDNGWEIKELPEKLKTDKDIALAAVKENGLVLEAIAYTFENDKDVVLASINDFSSGWNIKFASDQLRDDKEFMKEVVAISGMALRYASEKLQDDKDIVLTAIKNDPSALKYASDNMRNDVEIVKEAIKGHKDAIWYAGPQAKIEIDKSDKPKTIDEKLNQAKSIREGNTKEKTLKEKTEPER